MSFRSPMHVGALILLDVPPDRQDDFAGDIRRQFADRLPATPLLVRLHEAPDGYDSDVWADIARADLAALIVAEPHDAAWSEEELRWEEHTSELQSLLRISYAVFC